MPNIVWLIDSPYTNKSQGDPLRGIRSERWFVQAFSLTGAPLGKLDGCQSARLNFKRDGVRGTGSLSWEGDSVPNWLGMRLQFWYHADFFDGSSAEWPLMYAIPTTPEEKWDDGVVSQDIDVYDKLYLLNENSVDVTYEVLEGAVATTAARLVLTQIGITPAEIAITDSTKTIAQDMSWDPDTPRLTIVNEILTSINYSTLVADANGVFTSAPFVDPKSRGVQWAFKDAKDGIYDPAFSHIRDSFKVPNRVVCNTRGEGGFEGMQSIAVNNNPASPLSTVSRGITLTQTFNDLDAADQATLDALTLRKLGEVSRVASDVSLDHWLVPLEVDDAVTFANTPAGVDFLALVESVNINLTTEGFADVSTSIREVLL